MILEIIQTRLIKLLVLVVAFENSKLNNWGVLKNV